MELIKIFLTKLIKDSASDNKVFRRNLLKNYLQILVLDFIYADREYSQLIFYGGSCLAHCHKLPRLSEDLDFVDLKKKIEIHELAKDLERYFKKNTDLEVKAVSQKFRIYLKFPLLRELGMAGKSESDLLFLKIEIFKEFDFCADYKIETIPLFKFNKTVLVKTFDLPTLMATKIRAVLMRKWEKTDKNGKTLATVKGRDYYDLLWYLEKGVMPNFGCMEGIANKEELKEQLLTALMKVDTRSIRIDLESLIDNPELVKNLSKDIKGILKRVIANI
jgi:predicted nucleotidyltransferase component of viral defense system